MTDTVVVRAPGVAGYGRHAAPPAAYGPSDVHRLFPVSPVGSGPAELPESGDAPTETIGHAARPENVAARNTGTGDRSSDGAPMTTSGFWARLRSLSMAA